MNGMFSTKKRKKKKEKKFDLIICVLNEISFDLIICVWWCYYLKFSNCEVSNKTIWFDYLCWFELWSINKIVFVSLMLWSDLLGYKFPLIWVVSF